VGYVGGQGEQWLLARNQRGEQLLDLLETKSRFRAGQRRQTGPEQRRFFSVYQERRTSASTQINIAGG
jgi:hypothetical protein